MTSFPFLSQINPTHTKKILAHSSFNKNPKPNRSRNLSELSSLHPTDLSDRSSSKTQNLDPNPQNYSNARRKSVFSLDRKSRLTTVEAFNDTKRLTIFPMSNKTVLNSFCEYLTEYESEEVRSYHVIYFFGNSCLNKLKNPSEFDDEHGNYQARQGDHLIYRYEIFTMLGKGTFGASFKCFDHKLKHFCAVKIIKNKKRLLTQSETEVKILKKIKENNPDRKIGVVNILDNFRFRKHPCIVFELLDLSLLQHLRLNNRRTFPIEVCKSLTLCLLKSLDFLASLHIIHCDIKPANIVFSVDSKVPLKLIDFGTSCFFEDSMCSYIQSRYYRAPEVILGLPYNELIDMWSLGCVVYELVTGSILFQGKNENEVLKLIAHYRGRASSDMILKSKKPNFQWTDRQSTFEFSDKSLIDFLERIFHIGCLSIDPLTRLTASEALSHPWLKT